MELDMSTNTIYINHSELVSVYFDKKGMLLIFGNYKNPYGPRITVGKPIALTINCSPANIGTSILDTYHYLTSLTADCLDMKEYPYVKRKFYEQLTGSNWAKFAKKYCYLISVFLQEKENIIFEHWPKSKDNSFLPSEHSLPSVELLWDSSEETIGSIIVQMARTIITNEV
jgi:hypothetical protein